MKLPKLHEIFRRIDFEAKDSRFHICISKDKISVINSIAGIFLDRAAILGEYNKEFPGKLYIRAFDWALLCKKFDSLEVWQEPRQIVIKRGETETAIPYKEELSGYPDIESFVINMEVVLNPFEKIKDFGFDIALMNRILKILKPVEKCWDISKSKGSYKITSLDGKHSALIMGFLRN